MRVNSGIPPSLQGPEQIIGISMTYEPKPGLFDTVLFLELFQILLTLCHVLFRFHHFLWLMVEHLGSNTGQR